MLDKFRCFEPQKLLYKSRHKYYTWNMNKNNLLNIGVNKFRCFPNKTLHKLRHRLGNPSNFNKSKH